jgi:hypothetical protein
MLPEMSLKRGGPMNQTLKEKITEALTSVLPITLIVLLLSITITPLPAGTMMMFLTGACLLIVGMGFFSLGTDMAMMPIGDGIGAEITKSRKLSFMIPIGFFIGTVVTIAEPDLSVLANQVPAVPNSVLILTVAAGVGLFLVVAILRTVFQIPLSRMLVVFYLLIFFLAFFAPRDFIAVAFDSGGVTTGPITVPFIMALGIGMASIRADDGSREDSFGLVALCSIGPILAVLLLGIFYNPSTAGYEPAQVPDVFTTTDMADQFAAGFPTYLKEVVIALSPILVCTVIFQLVTRRFRKRQAIRIGVGALYTFVGLVLFLTGVNVGFMPAGHYIGAELAESSRRWLLVPLGMVIGYFIVAAEPAVHVLNKQVEEISDGAIPQKSMQLCLSIGVAVSIGLAMLRILTGISIFWLLIPGYAIAIGLTFVVPKVFTGIAFDSGGVASGPMTATFLLPFAMGACESVGGNVLTDAFGIVAMVAMTPLITIQLLGLVYKGHQKKSARQTALPAVEEEIIDFEENTDEKAYL